MTACASGFVNEAVATPAKRRSRGFTLVEVLVSMALLVIMTGLAWRGVDAMQLAIHRHTERMDRLSRADVALAQWRTDLDHLADTGGGEPGRLPWGGQVMSFSGDVLKLTRIGPDGRLQVVAWALQPTGRPEEPLALVRWSSKSLHTTADWQAAWQMAGASHTNPPAKGHWIEALPVAAWQVSFYRQRAWHEAASESPSIKPLPDAVRLELRLDRAGLDAAPLRLDWVLTSRGRART